MGKLQLSFPLVTGSQKSQSPSEESRNAAGIKGFSFPGGTDSWVMFLQVLLFILLKRQKKKQKTPVVALLVSQDGVQFPAVSLLLILLSDMVIELFQGNVANK